MRTVDWGRGFTRSTINLDLVVPVDSDKSEISSKIEFWEK
jgi:hypothetical protein